MAWVESQEEQILSLKSGWRANRLKFTGNIHIDGLSVEVGESPTAVFSAVNIHILSPVHLPLLPSNLLSNVNAYE